MQQNKQDGYVGLEEDRDGGMTYYGRMVMDARVFGLIDEQETCKGWPLSRMQGLIGQVASKWDEYGSIPSQLPEDLRARHQAEYDQAIKRAKKDGWDPDADLEGEA